MESPLDILKKYWNHNQFRPLQEDIINAVLDKNDTLALLPTGGGKSLCFQVPAMMLEGICIVVSPLIALMKDQVENLRKIGINAVAIYSGMNKMEIDILLDNCVYGHTKFLYVSPERLKTDIFIERVRKMDVNLIAIDEAHCISQWGYDFRPAYLEIIALRELLPQTKIIALTATATDDVKLDIIDKLELEKAQVFQKSFARQNLSYSVFKAEDKEKKLVEILKNVKGSAVVYAKTRKSTKDIADRLSKHGINATHYHAGLSQKERSQKQDDWSANHTRVIVATNAFGMGIDKPDVRVVVHMSLTQNLESYYQEAGRAGRDEQKAYAVLLYQDNDIEELKRHFKQSNPEIAYLKTIYQSLANFLKIATGSGFMSSYDFDLGHFSATYNHQQFDAYYAIKKLEHEGFIQLNESFYNPSKIKFKINHNALYDFQIAHSKYDTFIKTVLRLYGGELFSNFGIIIENKIASALKTSNTEVIKNLEALSNFGVIIYNKRKDQPQLVFLTPRHDAATLPLNKKGIIKKKNIDHQKMLSVIHYLKQKDVCRTRMILEYFGEESYLSCGICDICLQNKHTSQEDDNSLPFKIRQLIINQPLAIDEIVVKIEEKKDKIIEQVRMMLDTGELMYNDAGKIELK